MALDARRRGRVRRGGGEREGRARTRWGKRARGDLLLLFLLLDLLRPGARRSGVGLRPWLGLRPLLLLLLLLDAGRWARVAVCGCEAARRQRWSGGHVPAGSWRTWTADGRRLLRVRHARAWRWRPGERRLLLLLLAAGLRRWARASWRAGLRREAWRHVYRGMRSHRGRHGVLVWRQERKGRRGGSCPGRGCGRGRGRRCRQGVLGRRGSSGSPAGRSSSNVDLAISFTDSDRRFPSQARPSPVRQQVVPPALPGPIALATWQRSARLAPSRRRPPSPGTSSAP